MVFELEVTDLFGNVLYTLDQHDTPSVTEPISEDRSGGVKLSPYNPAVEHLIMVNPDGKVVPVLGRMIRIKYRGDTHLWGIVSDLDFDTDNDPPMIDFTIAGPSIKLHSRQANYSDSMVGPDEAPVHSQADWSLIEKLVKAGYDLPSQYAENIPDIGILFENVDAPNAPDGVWTDVQRGELLWDKIIEVASGLYGCDFELVPYDPTEDELPFDTTLVPVDEGP